MRDKKLPELVAGMVFTLIILLVFISCANILGDANKKNKGSIALSIPRMAGWLQSDAQVASGARALAFASSATIEIKKASGEAVVPAFTQVFNSEKEGRLEIVVPDVPVGDDYTIAVKVFNAKSANPAEPVVLGEKKGVNIQQGKTEGVSIVCLPHKPTVLERGVASEQISLNSGGEKWFVYKDNVKKTIFTVHSEPTENPSITKLALFDNQGKLITTSSENTISAAEGTLYLVLAKTRTSASEFWVKAQEQIALLDILGVTAPVLNMPPVTAIPETEQYTGTVSWTPAIGDNKFAADTAYTAIITLTAKSGYTFSGVTENSFAVAGATATNPADSGVVSAEFPATGLIDINFNNLTANGTSGTETTTALTLTFDKDPTGLTVDNITVSGASKGALTGSGTTRTLAISGITVNNGENVTVTLTNPTGFNIAPLSRDVGVWRRAIENKVIRAGSAYVFSLVPLDSASYALMYNLDDKTYVSKVPVDGDASTPSLIATYEADRSPRMLNLIQYAPGKFVYTNSRRHKGNNNSGAFYGRFDMPNGTVSNNVHKPLLTFGWSCWSSTSFAIDSSTLFFWYSTGGYYTPAAKKITVTDSDVSSVEFTLGTTNHFGVWSIDGTLLANGKYGIAYTSHADGFSPGDTVTSNGLQYNSINLDGSFAAKQLQITNFPNNDDDNFPDKTRILPTSGAFALVLGQNLTQQLSVYEVNESFTGAALTVTDSAAKYFDGFVINGNTALISYQVGTNLYYRKISYPTNTAAVLTFAGPETLIGPCANDSKAKLIKMSDNLCVIVYNGGSGIMQGKILY